jgi:hypothetical protein
MMKPIITRLAGLSFVRKAADKVDVTADLSVFDRRPSRKMIVGLFLIGFSYVIGWPLIALLAGLAVSAHAPMVIAVGGPLAYGLSHLVFLAGVYLAGAAYAKFFLRWLTRRRLSTGAVSSDRRSHRASEPPAQPPGFVPKR